MLNHQTTSISN